jgi:hypothetical protein
MSAYQAVWNVRFAVSTKLGELPPISRADLLLAGHLVLLAVEEAIYDRRS